MSDNDVARARAAKSGASDEPLSAAIIEKLKAEHAGIDLRLMSADGFTAVFKAPPWPEWKRFRALYMDAARRPDALETLCYGCLVYPSAEEFRAMLGRKPALAESWGAKLVAAAGPEQEGIEKKL